MGLNLEVARIKKSYNGQAVLRECSFVFDGGPDLRPARVPTAAANPPFCGSPPSWNPPTPGRCAMGITTSTLPHDLALRRRITLLLPRIGVFNTSVFHNVAYGLKIRGRRGREVEDRVTEALERVGPAPQAAAAGPGPLQRRNQALRHRPGPGHRARGLLPR